jgi:hypothetical protein
MERTLTSTAARQYARYVNLMITDAWNTPESEYKQLLAESFRLCARDGYDEAKQVLDQFYFDFLPALFEACLLGRPPEGANCDEVERNIPEGPQRTCSLISPSARAGPRCRGGRRSERSATA